MNDEKITDYEKEMNDMADAPGQPTFANNHGGYPLSPRFDCCCKYPCNFPLPATLLFKSILLCFNDFIYAVHLLCI